MNILYDYQMFTRQNYGGVSRYFVEIISHLPKQVNDVVSIAVKHSNNFFCR